jgi:hypothetical protein
MPDRAGRIAAAAPMEYLRAGERRGTQEIIGARSRPWPRSAP